MLLIKNIYIFSGLGADERVFRNLDFSEYSVTFIKWLIPQKKESISKYAARLLHQIRTEKPILIGLSFGGIAAIEVAKLIETENVIIIASAKTKYEIPFYYRWAGRFGFHRILPARFLKKSNFLTNWFFGKTCDFDKLLLKQVLFDTDLNFLEWAINQIVHWENVTLIQNVTHIHGSKDRILPKRFVGCDRIVKDGGHLMTIHKSDELNAVLRKTINE
jgi:pimeloyl-ACP methyl ester carboxylesterase